MDLKEITDEEAQSFLENGYLILRGVLDTEELNRVRTAMDELLAIGVDKVYQNADYIYGKGHLSGSPILQRIEYVIDKKDEMKSLLAHPFILRSVEKLIGPDLIPTWDSMVLKLPGEGMIVPWHRDAGTDQVGDRPIFNVDFYLDESTEGTCVWVIPGSNRWNPEKVESWLKEHRDKDLTVDDFRNSGAVPALMQPGDVMLHDILALHGSPSNETSNLRRVVYYEFRNAHVEQELGPHISEYIPLKQKVLYACIDHRKQSSYIPATEEPFAYQPPAPWNSVDHIFGTVPDTFRYPHDRFWRK